MIELIPWPQVALGVAAALAILGIYDVVYVWPLCRRLAGAIEKCRALEQQVNKAGDLERRIAEIENRNREHWGQVSERLGQLELLSDERSYEQAIGFAEQGQHADKLMACFGLTEGEANLVRLLHGDKERAVPTDSRTDDDARRLKFG